MPNYLYSWCYLDKYSRFSSKITRNKAKGQIEFSANLSSGKIKISTLRCSSSSSSSKDFTRTPFKRIQSIIESKKFEVHYKMRSRAMLIFLFTYAAFRRLQLCLLFNYNTSKWIFTNLVKTWIFERMFFVNRVKRIF